MRSPAKRGRRAGPTTILARLAGRVTLEAHASGKIVACFDGYSVDLGAFSAAAADRAKDLCLGLPLSAFVSATRSLDRELDLLVRRLAQHRLLEYRLRRTPADDDQIIIEPQVAEYWPRTPRVADADTLVLSRFAYLRRRGDEVVLESPRAGALFKIRNPKIATVLAAFSAPRRIKELRRLDGFPGLEILAVLVDGQILLEADVSGGSGSQLTEGDANFAFWEFHDLLFHTRSTEGRHGNPLGGLYRLAGVTPPLPAVRPCWPGKKIELDKFSAADAQPISSLGKLLHERHSIRTFDDQRPITLAELSRFLNNTARVVSSWRDKPPSGDTSPPVEYTLRPYPSAGASYELELYLAVNRCEGLARGFYHFDAGAHTLVPVAVRSQDLEALLTAAAFAMDAPDAPQILITIAARFGRVSWKYSSLAYALILKDVGVLTQTFYLMATDIGLGGCAIGTGNIDLFAKMTGIEFHIEGPVGQFTLGRPSFRPSAR